MIIKIALQAFLYFAISLFAIQGFELLENNHKLLSTRDSRIWASVCWVFGLFVGLYVSYFIWNY